MGLMASFMELGFTYKEALHTPFRVLTIMQAEKVRADYEEHDEIQQLSGREMMERKRNKQKQA